MKLSEAEKITRIIAAAEDQHGSATATRKIRNELCAAASVEFSDYLFWQTERNEIAVKKLTREPRAYVP